MATGTLKMWNADRGYGFVADDAGGSDIFLHISTLHAAGINPDNIKKGNRLSFDLESTREGKTRASNVRRPPMREGEIIKDSNDPRCYHWPLGNRTRSRCAAQGEREMTDVHTDGISALADRGWRHWWRSCYLLQR
jgi:CspA family cold shock protein